MSICVKVLVYKLRPCVKECPAKGGGCEFLNIHGETNSKWIPPPPAAIGGARGGVSSLCPSPRNIP